MNIEAAMPMKPHLKRYVEWRENIPQNGFIDITNSSSEISWVLGGVLTDYLKYKHDAQRKLSDEYSEQLRFKIDAYRFQANQIYFSPPQIRYFNTYVYRRMNFHLLEEVMRNQVHNIPARDTIWTFVNDSQMEGLISFDALLKANYRLRKTQDFPLFR